LKDRAEEDASDPIVRAYALEILRATAAMLGESRSGPTMSRALRDALARALWDNVQTFIRFVEEPKETFQAARVTLMLGAGDCDDHALLLFALARAAGVPVQMLFLDEDDQPVHVVDRMADSDGAWQWAETTVGAEYGEEPLAAVRRLRAAGALEGGDALSHTSMGDASANVPPAPEPVDDPDPSDVIAYRSMWDPYVTGAAKAMLACAALQTDPTEREFVASGATLLMMRWNLYAGLEPYEILLLAGEILTSYQETVAQVWPRFLADTHKLCPSVALPPIPTSDVQTQVIAKLEGARIIAAGVLQLFGQGVSGALDVLGPIVAAPFKPETWSTIKTLTIGAAVVAAALAVREVARTMPRRNPRRR
jgi:hypothetical protein